MSVFPRGSPLKKVVEVLENLIPLKLADKDFDNVGLLVSPSEEKSVKKIVLTNDLTEKVCQEAIDEKAQLVITYHPIWFKAAKRLDMKLWTHRVIVKCIEKEIAVYSPHTAADSITGGVNDWLVEPFEFETLQPITFSEIDKKWTHFFEIDQPQEELNLGEEPTILRGFRYEKSGSRIKFYCQSHESFREVLRYLEANGCDMADISLTKLDQNLSGVQGIGRFGTLKHPMKIIDVIKTVKSHLELRHVRLALGVNHNMDTPIKSIACCGGSAGNLFIDNNIKADIYLTGEYSHERILTAIHNNTSVILCDHSNTERGYLKRLQNKLKVLFGHNVSVVISRYDRDPIDIV